MADKEYPEGPQKVISRPGRGPLARLPHGGALFSGPVTHSWEPPRGAGPAAGGAAGRRQVSAPAAGAHGHPSPAPRAGPRGGEGVRRGARALPEVAVSRHRVWKARLPGLRPREARGQEGARAGLGPGLHWSLDSAVRTPRPARPDPWDGSGLQLWRALGLPQRLAQLRGYPGGRAKCPPCFPGDRCAWKHLGVQDKVLDAS